MKEWGLLGEAFENLGSDLRLECTNMETNCAAHKEFEVLFLMYDVMLETLKAQRLAVSIRFAKIDVRLSAGI